MKISQTISNVVTSAEAKALATTSLDGVNVVPISMIRVNNDSIWMFDFFMNKTAENLENTPSAAITCWSDMQGVQIKGKTRYITEGSEFEEAVAWVKTQNPDRVTKALIVLTPTEIFDISPGGAYTKEDLAIE